MSRDADTPLTLVAGETRARGRRDEKMRVTKNYDQQPNRDPFLYLKDWETHSTVKGMHYFLTDAKLKPLQI